MDKQDKADAEEDTDAPDYDPSWRPLIPVLRGELPAKIHAHRGGYIATAGADLPGVGLKYVIVHGMRATCCPSCWGGGGGGHHGPASPTAATGTGQPDHRNPAIWPGGGAGGHLHRPPGIPSIPAHLRRLAVRGGLEPRRPGRHHHPSRPVAGLDKRVGSLEPGKDADIVVTTGHRGLEREGALCVHRGKQVKALTAASNAHCERFTRIFRLACFFGGKLV
jgi:hypothetical protein